MPGPPATFGFDGVYGNEVHLYWEPPCERNGRLQKYKLTVSEDTSRRLQEIRPDSDVTEYQVKGLTLETSYQFELVATTSVGEGIPKILKTKTKGAPGEFFLDR